jgi:hypothetical protein
MKVIATQKGFFGKKRRNPGDIFVLSNEKEFSKVWMKTVDEAKAPKAEESEASEPAPEAAPESKGKGKVKGKAKDVI